MGGGIGCAFSDAATEGGGRPVGGLVIAGVAPAGQGMDDWLRMTDCDGVAGLAGAGRPGNQGGAYPLRGAVQSRADYCCQVGMRGIRPGYDSPPGHCGRQRRQHKDSAPGRQAGAENGAIDGGQYSIEGMGSSNG